MPNAVHSFA